MRYLYMEQKGMKVLIHPQTKEPLVCPYRPPLIVAGRLGMEVKEGACTDRCPMFIHHPKGSRDIIPYDSVSLYCTDLRHIELEKHETTELKIIK